MNGSDKTKTPPKRGWVKRGWLNDHHQDSAVQHHGAVDCSEKFEAVVFHLIT
jgi:hypothetical protein